MLVKRSFYNSVPAPRTKDEDNPTLLYSWWCTIFAMVIILIRLGGRLVRNDMLFREDKIMFASIIPLLIRMAFIHVVLIWGTNNADLSNVTDPTELYHRQIGSRLVLAARVFYALFIWTAKFTVLDFLKRMTNRFWRRSFEIAMQFITWYLVATFIAVVLATILECHPITHYWQVQPYPGPQCTEAYVQLVTMAAADVTTDLLIVTFPIPVIIASAMPLKKKISLCLLFSLNIILIVITLIRVPSVINHHGVQQYRTVWASSEILAAAAVSNTVVIGSFLRDRGLKKARYKLGSQTDSMDRRSVRRPTLASQQQWGSEEDLAAEMGYRLDPALYEDIPPRPARPVQPHGSISEPTDMTPINAKDWQFPAENGNSSRESEDSTLKPEKPNEGFRAALEATPPMVSPRTVNVVHPDSNTSFFDMGGLLHNGPARSRRSSAAVAMGAAPNGLMSLAEAPESETPRARRGSRALLADIGGLLSPTRGSSPQPPQQQQDEITPVPLRDLSGSKSPSRSNLSPPSQSTSSLPRSRSKSPRHDAAASPSQTSTTTSYPPTGVRSPMITSKLTREQTLQDVGGLLVADPEALQPRHPLNLQDVGGLAGPSTGSSHRGASKSPSRAAGPS